ncbi:MAG TPA: ribosome biogenesis GTPase Der [Candidatus Dormibacteraeota bacterium]|nr:ribosome biogenesis GTPase Der [Candidatus Dormibacteraeota bacterium]
MARPIVAIVGRPNVGKSTLFNRLIGQRKAIVDAQAGLTRDRLYGVAEWRGREFSVVDTAGLDLDGRDDPSRAAIEAQTRIAIDQAEVILLLLDVRQGLTAIDRDIAAMLRKSRRQIIVAANKADSPNDRHFAHELLELGFDEPSLISAQHGLGVGELLDRILSALPASETELADSAADRLAIMGRPNVGKSSLLNALLGDERALVSATPGTTRDPIDTDLVFDGVPVVLVDTAGIRRKSSSRDRLERYSLLRGIAAMERSDAVLLVVDASAGVLAQDQHVAGYALDAGKGLVIVVNKIDLVEPAMRKPAHWRKALAGEFKFATFAPVVTVSAKTKEGIGTILPTALEVVGQRRIKIPPSELNRVLRDAFQEHPPPSFKGKRLRLNYATQAGAEAPTVVLFVNDTGLLHFSYRRYLEKKIRDRFGLFGNPLRLVLRSDSNRRQITGTKAGSRR